MSYSRIEPPNLICFRSLVRLLSGLIIMRHSIRYKITPDRRQSALLTIKERGLKFAIKIAICRPVGSKTLFLMIFIYIRR